MLILSIERRCGAPTKCLPGKVEPRLVVVRGRASFPFQGTSPRSEPLGVGQLLMKSCLPSWTFNCGGNLVATKSASEPWPEPAFAPNTMQSLDRIAFAILRVL